MKRRSFIITAVVATTTLTLTMTACSPPGQESGDQSLVVYSNSVSDGRGDWLKEQAAKAGFTLNIVDLGGGDVMNRIIAEKNNPIADVTFGLNNVYFEKLKTADALEPYSPAWADKVDPETGDPETKLFWPIVREPIMLVYNKAAYPTAQQAPQDWPDLWQKPEFQGKYEVPTALGGATTQTVIAGLLSRYLDANGELGVGQEGWQQIQQYFANGSPAVQGKDLYARMEAGDVNAGQMWLAGKANREKQYGIKTEPVHPQIGVPFVYQHVAMVKGTKKAETAQKFIDWFGSAEIQAGWSQKFFTAPANTDAVATANQDAIKQTDAFTAQDIDWTVVAKNIDQWVEKIALEYVKN